MVCLEAYLVGYLEAQDQHKGHKKKVPQWLIYVIRLSTSRSVFWRWLQRQYQHYQQQQLQQRQRSKNIDNTCTSKSTSKGTNDTVVDSNYLGDVELGDTTIPVSHNPMRTISSASTVSSVGTVGSPSGSLPTTTNTTNTTTVTNKALSSTDSDSSDEAVPSNVEKLDNNNFSHYSVSGNFGSNTTATTATTVAGAHLSNRFNPHWLGTSEHQGADEQQQQYVQEDTSANVKSRVMDEEDAPYTWAKGIYAVDNFARVGLPASFTLVLLVYMFDASA